jgi:hypothetical protein
MVLSQEYLVQGTHLFQLILKNLSFSEFLKGDP